MLRIAEVGLVSAVVLAVLAFGGTEPLSFSVVQIVLFGLGVLLLLTYVTPRVGKPRLPVAIPLFLVCLVLLQIAPLPASVLQLFHHAGNPLGRTSFATISLAPYETASHLVVLLTYLAAFYLTLVVCQLPNGSRHLVFTLLALGTFEACYGLFQYLTGWQHIFTYVKKHNLEQATGTYINPNHYAGVLEMILPFALALAFYQFGKIPKARADADRMRSFFSHGEFQKSLLWVFLAIVLFVGLVFSQSRMGIISALVSTVLLFTLIATSGLRRINAALLATAFLSAAILTVVWIGPEPVIGRFEAFGQEYAATGQNRWAIWQDTLHLIRQHPWLGSGVGTFPIAYTSVQTTLLSWFVDYAHNDYLQLVSEAGLPMALLFFGAVFYLLARSIRHFRISGPRFDRAVALGCFGALVAILLHNLTDFNLYIAANALLFAMILGLACATSAKELQGGAEVTNSPGCSGAEP